jgi:hypothetical protein
MNTFVLLTLLSVVGVAALFIALAWFLFKIIHELESIGGPASRFRSAVNYLSKIRLGVRAIEVETGHLLPQVAKLNAGLGGIRDGLRAIEANLSGVIAAVTKQGQR